MRSAVVFYSYDGNTRVAAKVIADKTDAGIYELEEVKKRGRTGFAFMAGALSALTGRGSKLKDIFAERLKGYERIFIGTPIWAGKPVPAINTFIRKSDFSGKEIVLFTVQADENPEVSSVKCSDAIKNALGKKGAVLKKSLRLRGEAPGKTINIEEMRKQLETHI